jgi:hypothetical protein
MSFNKSFSEVLAEAKKAFEDVERSSYEKYVAGKKPKRKTKKKVGFIDGMREITVYI